MWSPGIGHFLARRARLSRHHGQMAVHSPGEVIRAVLDGIALNQAGSPCSNGAPRMKCP
jgi:hypothetical protein